MLFNKKQSQKMLFCQRGVTLLETVVGIALVSFVTLSLYMALFNVTKLMGDSKQKIGAVALANERIEIIRNLEYDNVGTQGWIPSGPIPQTEELEKNGFTYTVNTAIEYVDDVFDGQGAGDDISNDYKQAWVEVQWMLAGQTKSVLFTSRFVPNGLETDAGGGVLSINVIDSLATQIAGAIVQVDSVNESPAVHGSSATDATGNVRLPGMPPQEYKITVSKSDYETVMTFANPPSSPFTPIDSNMIVIEGATVLKTISIDKSADLMFTAVDIADGNGISGVDLDLLGGRIIGTDPTTYTIDQTQTTDSSGEADLTSIASGSYDITNLVTLETATHQFIGSDTGIPIALASEDDVEVNLMFAEKAIDSLLVKALDDVTLQPISGAEIHITASGFDQTVTTLADGLAYFPVTEDPVVTMSPQEYHVDIQTTGYQDYSDDVDVSQLTTFDASLTSL